MSNTGEKDTRKLAARVIRDEAQALNLLADMIGEDFERAVDTIHRSGGRLIVTGLGKSGVIGGKIAATLTSTGTPAVFLHPVEAMHGDLGIVTRQDHLLVLSKSGKTEEVAKLVAVFRQLGGQTIVITENPASPLAAVADIVLRIPAVPEACPLRLAPTTSTTLMLALGDALAMALLDRKGFTQGDFAQYHPDGTLGVGALLRAQDIMHAGDKVPLVGQRASFGELLDVMTDKSLGMACVVDDQGRLLGAITDGDLRRILKRSSNPMSLTMEQALSVSPRTAGMPHRPITIRPQTMAIECRQIMRSNMITALIAVDDQERPVGIVRMHDLLAAGLG